MNGPNGKIATDMNICAHAAMYLLNTMPHGRNMPDKDILMPPEHTGRYGQMKVSHIYIRKHTLSRQMMKLRYEPLPTTRPACSQVSTSKGSSLVKLRIRATGRKMKRLKSPRNPRNCAILTCPLFPSSSGSFLRIRVIYTAYNAAETSARMSPRRGFEAAVKPASESPKLTIIVPAIQRRTLTSFNQVKFSPKNARETKNVKRLDALLKMVFDCKQQGEEPIRWGNMWKK
jgi:hypothetical protein